MSTDQVWAHMQPKSLGIAIKKKTKDDEAEPAKKKVGAIPCLLASDSRHAGP